MHEKDRNQIIVILNTQYCWFFPVFINFYYICILV